MRFKTQIKLLAKARKIVNEHGIKPRSVSVKILLPLLENASLENDEDLLDLWANLLANAANPEKSDNVGLGYIEVLKLLSPKEAIVLEKLYDYLKKGYVLDPDIYSGKPVRFDQGVIYHLVKYEDDELPEEIEEKLSRIVSIKNVLINEADALIEKGYVIKDTYAKNVTLIKYEEEED